jgi:hypothetical protein
MLTSHTCASALQSCSETFLGFASFIGRVNVLPVMAENYFWALSRGIVRVEKEEKGRQYENIVSV